MPPTSSEPLREWIRGVPYSVRYLLNAYPSVYAPLIWIRHRHDEMWMVDPSTELVIEGMGRSGNTFAVAAFQLAQPSPVRVVHHTHSAAQVIRAVRLRRPVLVIVREPSAVVLSQMILRGIPPSPPLHAWIRFHRRILPWREHLSVCTFEDVTSDFSGVIRRVNQRFGTRFAEFEHTPENVDRVFQRIGELDRAMFGGTGDVRWVAKPTAEREGAKAELRTRYEVDRLRRLRFEAGELYEELTRRSDR